MTPGPDHPITLERSPCHVVVRSGSVVVAETDQALEMREATYQPVFYIPLDDVDRQPPADQRSSQLLSLQGRGFLLRHRRRRGDGPERRVWYYDDPFPAVAGIKGHVAFYADRVDRQGHTQPV